MHKKVVAPGFISANHADLAHLESVVIEAAGILVSVVRENGGKILAAGNGGSCADALHLSGELLKSFLLPRPIDRETARALEKYPFGRELAESLEAGAPVVVLGQNPSLSSAYLNDRGAAHSLMAQECLALVRPGDAVVFLSTSGEAENLVRALAVAKARGARSIAFTGKGGGRMGIMADVEIRSPARETPRVQEHHVILYHALCMLVEKELFGE